MATDNFAPTLSPPARSGDRSTVVVRRRLVAVAMVLAAVTVVVGHLLNVPATLPTGEFLDRVEANRPGFLFGGLLQATAAFLLIPSALGIAALAPSRGAAWATVGTALTGIGAAATGAGLVMVTTTMAMLAGSDAKLAGRVYDLAGHSPVAGLPFLLAPAMAVGLLLLGIALWRAGTVHRASAVLLMVAAVLTGLAPGGGAAGALGHLPLAVALVVLAVTSWSRTRAPRTT
jgi:MFS family permease